MKCWKCESKIVQIFNIMLSVFTSYIYNVILYFCMGDIFFWIDFEYISNTMQSKETIHNSRYFGAVMP